MSTVQVVSGWVASDVDSKGQATKTTLKTMLPAPFFRRTQRRNMAASVTGSCLASRISTLMLEEVG